MIIQHLANLPSSCPSDSSSLENCISALKSSVSALESSIKITEGSSDSWERFGWLCAIVVGIGVLGEIIVIVSEYREDLEGWRCGIVRTPDEPPAWRFWFNIAATLLVVGGVFGEAGAASKIASINSQSRSKGSELRAKSDQLLGVITQEAARSNKEAAQLRKEAAELRQRVAPRRLTNQEEMELAKTLKPYAPQQYELFITTVSDPEIEEFFGTLSRALDGVGAGWEQVNSGKTDPVTTSGVIVMVLQSCSPATSKGADALVSWLRQHGRPARKVVFKSKNSHPLGLFFREVEKPREVIEITVSKRI